MEKKQYACPEIITVQLASRTSLLILSDGSTLTIPEDPVGGDGSDAASRLYRTNVWDDGGAAE